MKTVTKIGLVLVFLVFCLLTLPALHFFSTLRPAESYGEDAALSDLFSSHGAKLSSRISSGSADERFICASCKAHASTHASCEHAMSDFVTEHLAERAGAKTFWGLDRVLMSWAVRLKYDRDTLEDLYLAMLADLFGKKHLDHACEDFFSKPCDELSPREGARLAHAFHSRRPPSQLADDPPASLEECWR